MAGRAGPIKPSCCCCCAVLCCAVCRGELEEVLRYVKPQHFLPVHGEYAFLCAHAQVCGLGGHVQGGVRCMWL